MKFCLSKLNTSYLAKRFPNLSCSLLPIFYPLIWAFLCGSFGFLVIFVRADFEVTGTKDIFMYTTPIYVLMAGVLTFFEYVDIGPFKKKGKFWFLNKYIIGDRISSEISDKNLKKLFYSLTERPADAFRAAVKYAGMVIALVLLTEWIASGSTANLLVIVIGGLISLFLLSLFITFFAQRFIFPTLRECRAMLNERGETIEEPRFRFSDLETKFRFFLLIPILVVLVVLTLVSVLDIGVIIISLIGLIMAIMVSQQLSSSIYDAFLGIKEFAKKLPGEQRTAFSTGSLDTEIIDLSESLNKASDEVYTAREKVKRSEKELRKRLEELERWYRLTVGRELKMAELKEEIKKFKNV